MVTQNENTVLDRSPQKENSALLESIVLSTVDLLRSPP